MATRWTSGTPLRDRLSHLPDGVEHRLQPGFEAAAGQVGIGDPWGRDHVRGGRELRKRWSRRLASKLHLNRTPYAPTVAPIDGIDVN